MSSPLPADTDTTPKRTPLQVVPKKPIAQYITGVVLAVLAIAFLWSSANNENFQWAVVGKYVTDGDILLGLWRTIWLTAASMLIGIVLGVITALMRMSRNPISRAVSGAYVWFFRGTPILVQLIFWFNAAALWPELSFFGLGSVETNAIITPYIAALLGLGLNEGAYMSEIIRAGIVGVEPGQTTAARALGMPRVKVMRLVVLPQAMRIIVPPSANQTINMLKITSLVSVVAIPDLLYSVQTIYSRTFETIPLLVVACLWYIIVTTILTVVQSRLERRYGRGSESRS